MKNKASSLEHSYRQGGDTGVPRMVMAPGVGLMNGIWKAMAWVAEDIESSETDSEGKELFETFYSCCKIVSQAQNQPSKCIQVCTGSKLF